MRKNNQVWCCQELLPCVPALVPRPAIWVHHHLHQTKQVPALNSPKPQTWRSSCLSNFSLPLVPSLVALTITCVNRKPAINGRCSPDTFGKIGKRAIGELTSQFKNTSFSGKHWGNHGKPFFMPFMRVHHSYSHDMIFRHLNALIDFVAGLLGKKRIGLWQWLWVK